MKLPLESNIQRHVEKIAHILHYGNLDHQIQRNRRRFQSSIAVLYRYSLSLLKREKDIRMMRMKVDRIRRQATRLVQQFSLVQHAEIEENIDVVDSELSEIIVTQDDVEGEEQLERLENVEEISLRTGADHSSIRGEHVNSDPIDLSCSSLCTGHSKTQRPVFDNRLSPRPLHVFDHPTTVNSLPSRRSADDHLEQFMMVDPNQNIKWKQLADKFNKELGPNVCGVCHKTLSCKSALTMHYRVHTEERPFVCKICEKRFSTKGNLKTHLGQHSDLTDQYCLNSSMAANQMKPGNIMVPSSTMPSTTTLNPHHTRIPLHHTGFPFSFPGLSGNPNFLLNMFSHSNGDFNMLDALKVGQKFPIPDILGKPDDANREFVCHFCRQTFPSNDTLEVHVRSQGCKKEFPVGKLLVTGRDRIAIGQNDGKCKIGDNEQKMSSDKFSLTNLMALNSHQGSLFSLMNNPSFLHRPMIPHFPGFVPQMCSSTPPWIPRMPLSNGGPLNNFIYNYSDIDGK